MMRMRNKLTGVSPATGAGGGEGGTENWEMRPCGMLVQKRSDSDPEFKPVPIIRVRVKFGSIYHQININSQATFGELKKMLTGPTGLHHEDQKLFFKDKERNSKEFLDIVGLKDKSKVVLVEDPISQEKRYLEMRKNAKMEKAAKSISEISLEVDKLATQVAALESMISKGRRVAEKEVVNLIELLMNELIKLDGIVADGDVKLQRKMQVRRVQKYVETLDVLKIKNSTESNNNGQTPNNDYQRFANGHTKNSISSTNGAQTPRHSNRQKPPLPPQHQSRQSTSGTVVTTQWETFDSAPPLIPVSPKSTPVPTGTSSGNHKFNWELL